MIYNGTPYYYITNLQGDVVRLVDTNGVTQATYTYDPWGKVSVSNDATDTGIANPLRYRGYYYDTELEMYYLQSRYYDPQIGRFINADQFVSTGQGFLGFNMFAYCNNSPVVHKDDTGHNTAVIDLLKGGMFVLPFVDGPFPIGDIIAGIVAVGIVYYSASDSNNNNSDKIDWEAGDKNHILQGTDRKHRSGWKKFGIDPDDPNSWDKLLPILKEVVDEADRVSPPTSVKGGGQIVKYFKYYANEGVNVMVKIWTAVGELIDKLSDAIPYD